MIPSRLFRASHSHNLDRIRNPLIFFENGCLLLRVLMIPSRLLRASHSLNLDRIRNPLIFLRKMAPYSCGTALESPDAPASELASHRRLSTLGIIT